MRSMKTTALLYEGLSVAILALSCGATASDDAQWIDAQRRKWNVPGVTVAVVQPGKSPRVYASGICRSEQRTPCSPDSPFHIGSLTKFFTGLVAATLAAEKQLRLDEPLIIAWPEFRLSDPRWTEVTLRDLLGGRSGLGSVDWPFFWDQSLTRQDYLARIAYMPMAEPFRGRWSYANANFVAAGAYLERVSGKSWEALIQERVLVPLKMHSSGFQLAAGQNTGYALEANGRDVAIPVTTTQAIGPAGTMVSTARDISNFMQMVLNDGQWAGQQVLPVAAVSGATSPVIGLGYDRRFYGPPGAYGFGVFLASYRNNTILYHRGGYPGYTAHFALLPQQKLGVVVLANRNASLFSEALTLGLLDRALSISGEETMSRWLEAQEPEAPEPVSQSPAAPTRPLSEYEGQYHNPAWGDFKIIRVQGQLKIRFGTFETKLEHYRFDSFSFVSMLGWERMRLRFDADFKGNITGFLLDDATNVQTQKFERLTAAGTTGGH